ncbi:MAG: hypothetical protein U0103_10870 [Candidatus Obscuribacterales bacterium]|nr:hypothetical protein [Cyanobacteria bacterium SZAS LIN-5]RTL41489.1 MAG: hypothetical protein EKK48_14080 [Candidatus Melainabacteria bacterium]
MPDSVLDKIERDERDGNYVAAFQEARSYIYGNPLDPIQSNGWKERATQLVNELNKAHSQSGPDSLILPPFEISPDGTAIQPDFPELKITESNGSTDVILPSGWAYNVSADRQILQVRDPETTQTNSYSFDPVSGTYIGSDPKYAFRLVENPTGAAEQSLMVLDRRNLNLSQNDHSTTTVTYASNGDVTTTTDYDGYEKTDTMKANGLRISLTESNGKPLQYVITYPDQSTISVTYDFTGSVDNGPYSAVTTYSVIDSNAQRRIYYQESGDEKLVSAHDALGMPLFETLPAKFILSDSSGSYVIDNQTLAATLTPADRNLNTTTFLLAGRQPVLDSASSSGVPATLAGTTSPLAQTAQPTATPVNPMHAFMEPVPTTSG